MAPEPPVRTPGMAPGEYALAILRYRSEQARARNAQERAARYRARAERRPPEQPETFYEVWARGMPPTHKEGAGQRPAGACASSPDAARAAAGAVPTPAASARSTSGGLGSLCLAVVLSQPAFLRAASIKSVAMAMATCREARDAVRATIAAMAAETREIEARVHHHGTIKSLQDPEFPAWGPSNGIYVGGRDPTKTRESCEMVALMSVDAAKSNWRVLFTVTLACHNACDPGCSYDDSNSFVIRAFVQHLGVWQWVPVFTIYNVCGTFDAEVIAVASPTVESELCTRLELDKGQLGFVVRALILNSEVHHFRNVSRTPWAYAVVAHAAKKKFLRMKNEDAFERLIERTCWTVDSVVESATDRRDEEAREAAAEERNALIEYDTARCFPRRFGVPEPPPWSAPSTAWAFPSSLRLPSWASWLPPSEPNPTGRTQGAALAAPF